MLSLVVIILAIISFFIIIGMYASALIKKPNKITEYFWGTDEDYE